MAKSFRVDVVAPDGPVWSGEAEFVVARTTEGEIGILADHEPLMAALTTGAVIVESGDERTTIGVHGGFMQVVDNTVTLLTDRAQVATGRDEAADVAKELGRLASDEEALERMNEEEAAGE